MDSPEVGTLILDRLDRVKGTMTSVNSARAPKDARKAFEHAMASVKKKHDDEAQPELEKAVAIYPQYAQAWLELGRVRERQSHFEEARAAYNKALESDNRYVDPYLHLADLAVRAQDWKQTAQYTGKVIELDPIDYPMACFFNAVANYNLGEMEQAEKSARRVKLLDGQRKIKQVDHLLGMILYAKKDYSGAIDSMRTYLDKAPNASDAASVRQQLAELERMRAGAQK